MTNAMWSIILDSFIYFHAYFHAIHCPLCVSFVFLCRCVSQLVKCTACPLCVQKLMWASKDLGFVFELGGHHNLLDAVCVCVHTQWTSSTDGMRGIETPFVFEGRNGSDLRPSNPGHALLTSLSLSFPLSISLFPAQLFDTSLFHLKTVPSTFSSQHGLNFFFWVVRFECIGWIDIVLQQAVGFSFLLIKYRTQLCVKCWVSYEQAKYAIDRVSWW